MDPGDKTPPAGDCLHERVAAQAARTPDAVAVTCGKAALSYRELCRQAGALAGELRAEGVGPEVLVGVAMERSPELPVTLLAILAAGGAYVPLDPSYPAERLRFMAADSAVPVIVTQERLAASLPAFNQSARILVADRHRAAEEVDDAPWPAAAADPSGLAYVIYTSGSTGRPKGAMNCHRAIVNRLLWMQERYVLGPGDAVLQKTPTSFDVSVWELFWPLLAGARLVMAMPDVHRDAGLLAREIVDFGITTIHFVPSMLAAFLDQPGVERCASLRRVFASGEALPADLAARFFARLPGAELHNLYGPTEAAVDVTAWECERAPGGVGPAASPATIPIGWPVANTSIHLLDAGGGPVPDGETGELAIGGVQVGRGYWHRPALTAERFVPDLFAAAAGTRLYRTGDLARRRPDGAFEFLGRLDHQVKIRGVRVEPGEVEAALRTHPAVAEAVVVTQEVIPGEVSLVAYLTATPGRRPDAGGLREAVLARLPEPMTPSFFVLLDALPRAPNGKLDRLALPRLVAQDAKRAADATDPRTPIEETVAGFFAEILGLASVDARASFFALGGQSLLATRLMARVGTAFGVALDVRALAESPTIEQLALRIEEAVAAGRRRELPPLAPVPRDIPLVPSFAQERRWLLESQGMGRAAHHLPLALRLTGPWNAGAFAWALGQVEHRQEALRTRFANAGGRPRPIVEPPAGLTLPLIDLTGLGEPRAETELQRSIHDLVRPAFELDRAPLLRTGLFRLAPEDYALVMAMHPIVSDEASLGILVRDLSRFYFHQVDGCPLPDELALQYTDYAHWQRRALSGEVLAGELAYWRAALAGLLSGGPLAGLGPALPTDRPRTAAPSRRGGTAELRLPDAVAASLAEFSRSRRASLFTTLLAAFQALLGRFVGGGHAVAGIPVSGRRGLLDLEVLIGPFANLLPISTDLSGDPSFEDLLERVRAAVLAAHLHQEVPLEKLLAELEVDDRGPAPPVPATFVLRVVQPSLPATLALAPLPLATETVEHDLRLVMVEEGGELSGLLEYDIELFDAVTACRLLGDYGRLLAALAGDPGLRLSALPSLGAAERHQLTGGTPDTVPREAPPMEISIIGLGKLGLSLASCLAAAGHRVTGIDCDAGLIDRLRRGAFECAEPGVAERLAAAGERFRAAASTSEAGAAISASRLSFVVVPTPSNDLGGFSLSQVLAACDRIGAALQGRDGEHTVAVVSTLLPGASDRAVIPRLEAASGRRIGARLGYCYNPSFIALGEVVRGLERPDLLLIGEADEPSGEVVLAAHRRMLVNGAPASRLKPVEAEIAKIAANTHATLRMSFANMLLEACSEVPGTDVDRITGALAHSIGPRFLRGAVPYGGPCFPRDNDAIAAFLEAVGVSSRLPRTVHKFNQEHGSYVLRKVLALSEPGGTVGLLGLAYKPGTPFVEHAFALDLARALGAEGRAVIGWDLLAAGEASRAMGGALAIAGSAEECLRRSGVAVVLHPLADAGGIDWSAGCNTTVVDCWRTLPASAAGLLGRYLALGRGPWAGEDGLDWGTGLDPLSE
jgi:nucleotide sugar dehydrogenase